MAEAAATLLDSLDHAQRNAAMFDFAVDGERERWYYTPTDHGGLPLAAMTSAQHRNTMRLVATGLSRAGYVTTASIMGLENVLDLTEGFVSGFGRDRGRDPLLYWVSIFRSPDDSAWSWRFGGHHISLHFTIVDGEISSTTPCFLGADPASSPLLGPHLHRPLGGAEDLGRELMHSLSDEQREVGWLSRIAPVDLVGVNRPVLTDGDTTLDLPLIWRGRLDDDLDAVMAAAHQAARRQGRRHTRGAGRRFVHDETKRGGSGHVRQRSAGNPARHCSAPTSVGLRMTSPTPSWQSSTVMPSDRSRSPGLAASRSVSRTTTASRVHNCSASTTTHSAM